MMKAVTNAFLKAVATAAFMFSVSGGGAAAQPEQQDLIRIDHEIFVSATPADIWTALTTPAGLKKWLAPEVNVSIELDGPYELFFWPDNPDDRGQEGTRVLSYLPNEMLSYTGELDGTWVVWRLTPENGGTRVRIASLGFSEDWKKRAPYFDDAMPGVLARLAASIQN